MSSSNCSSYDKNSRWRHAANCLTGSSTETKTLTHSSNCRIIHFFAPYYCCAMEVISLLPNILFVFFLRILPRFIFARNFYFLFTSKNMVAYFVFISSFFFHSTLLLKAIQFGLFSALFTEEYLVRSQLHFAPKICTLTARILECQLAFRTNPFLSTFLIFLLKR